MKTEPEVYPYSRRLWTRLFGFPVGFKLGSFKVDFLGWGFIDEGWWRNYLHAHTYYEICYAFGGEGTFKILGTTYKVRKGDVFIAKPREDHEIISSRTAPLQIYFWSYTLLHDHQPSNEKRPPDPRREAIDQLLHAYVSSSLWVSSRVPGMDQTLQLMTEEIVRGESGYTNVIEGLAGKLVLDTARASIKDPMPGEVTPLAVKRSQEMLVRQALHFMRDNMDRDLTVAHIAGQVSLSERHFSRLFQRQTGKSVQAALAEARMGAAAQLLLDPALPIKEIALRVGIRDVRYFTTVFRKYHGAPPATFRAAGGTSFKKRKPRA